MNSRRSDCQSSPDENSVKIYSIRQEARRESKPSKWTWTIPLGILVLLVGLYFIWPGYRGFMDEAYHALASGKQERVEQWVSSFGTWSYLVVLVLMLMQTLLAFLPSLLIMSVSVLAFGPVVGGLLAWRGCSWQRASATASGAVSAP